MPVSTAVLGTERRCGLCWQGEHDKRKRWLAVCRIVDVEQWRTPTADPDKSHHGSRSVVRNPVPPWSIEGVDAPKTVGY